MLGNFRPSSALRLNASFNGYWIDRDAAQITLLFPYVHSLTLPASSDFTWDGKLGIDASIAQGTKLQLSGQYYAPRLVAQGQQDARSSVDFSVAHDVTDRIKASLSVTDIFNNFGTSTFVRGNGFDVRYENFYETQTVMFSLEMKL